MGAVIKITEEQARYIFVAQVIGSYGSAERIRMKEDIGKAFQDLAIKKEAGPVEIEFSKAELKAWAAGCIAGWKSETISTQAGPVTMTDVDRNIIRISAKALRVWEAVRKQIPEVEAEDFEIDPEIEDDFNLDEAAE